MRFRRLCGLAGVGVMAASTLMFGSPAASAQPCPDAEIVFARGSDEPPGVGNTGQAFIDAVRGLLPGKSIGVYPVNYPATGDFGNHAVFPSTMFDGVGDASSHLKAVAAACPNTKMLLGGYSQGAAVAAYTTTNPDVPAAVHDHVAGIVLFGTPTPTMLAQYGAPPANISPLYDGKSLNLCAPGDSICDGSPGSLLSILAHGLYPLSGLTNKAAAAAAARIA